MRKRRAQGQQAAASGAFLWVVFYAFQSPESCQYFCRCRSASFFRRTRAAQSGQYLARLDFGVNTAPHSTQCFTSSRLLLISAHRAASSSELAMAKSVRKNAQPQIENLCSKGAWGTSLNKRVWLASIIPNWTNQLLRSLMLQIKAVEYTPAELP